MESSDLYPLPSRATLATAFIGKQLDEVPLPAVVVDRAIAKRNCDRMLSACKALGVQFRPHIKTHKTVEVTRLQVGDDSQNVNIVVSTIAEAEHVREYLLECKEQGKTVNVLYGLPLPISQVGRLGRLGQILGAGSISVMIDHPDQLSSLHEFKKIAGFPAEIFVKIDSGYGRAGLPPQSDSVRVLLESIFQSCDDEESDHLRGFYSHAGHSYYVDTGGSAMNLLAEEIEGLMSAVGHANRLGSQRGQSKKYVLSVGATPSATSAQNLIDEAMKGHSSESQEEAMRLRQCIDTANRSFVLELHAGVYPFLDMQQLATHSRITGLGIPDMALTVLVEVVSLYTHREPPEALIAAGSLALGREPCKSYGGWGVVMSPVSDVEQSDWEVARISQEHGVLKRMPTSGSSTELHVGQRVRIWPNHACIAGPSFSLYFVVDSDLPSKRQDEIVDVWIRCRGW